MIDFNFSRDVVDAFTCGDCNYLAMDLHLRFGYDIIALCEKMENGEQDWWKHFVCALPDGRVFDITGIYDLENMSRIWGCEVRDAVFSRDLCEATVLGQDRIFPDYSSFEYADEVYGCLERLGLAPQKDAA